ncbi:hypothetical protein ES705_50423 [subsurface metagenome]
MSRCLGNHGITAIAEVCVFHTQGGEDILLNILDVGLSGDFGHNLPCEQKVRVGVGGS